MRKEIDYDGILITEIKKSDKASLKIGIKEFNGRSFIDIREWVDEPDYSGPTKKGATLVVSKFEDLKFAIKKLEKHITEKGVGENE